jgi:hypothetical protein
VIKDVGRFQTQVLPRYFRHNKMNSFIRQLNMYGFHKSRTDHAKSVFSHPAFLRGREYFPHNAATSFPPSSAKLRAGQANTQKNIRNCPLKWRNRRSGRKCRSTNGTPRRRNRDRRGRRGRGRAGRLQRTCRKRAGSW